MFTVRHGVFETNSSSCHCVTIGKHTRPISEFPVPDENGVIAIDLNVADSFINYAEMKTFLDYLILALLYINQGEKVSSMSYSPGSGTQKDLVKWINIIYAMVGLPKVTKLVVHWSAFVEFNETGTGDCHCYHDHADYLCGLQSGYGLDAFFNSFDYPVSTVPEGYEKFIEGWDDEDYKKNVALYNSALAMVYDTTSEIREDH